MLASAVVIDDALLDAPGRLDGLDDEHPLGELVQVDVGGVALHREVLGEPGPQAGALARLVVVEEAGALEPAGTAELDHLLDDRPRPGARRTRRPAPRAPRCGS